MIKGFKRKRLYNELIAQFIPINIKTYVEPFGGSFIVKSYLSSKPQKSVYNDIKTYSNLEIDADIILHKDYKEIFKDFDSIDTVFYLDPPYYGKEFYYDLPKFDKKFHQELHDEIKKLKGKVILSYEGVNYINDLYSDMNIHTYQGDSKILKSEIVITNF